MDNIERIGEGVGVWEVGQGCHTHSEAHFSEMNPGACKEAVEHVEKKWGIPAQEGTFWSSSKATA